MAIAETEASEPAGLSAVEQEVIVFFVRLAQGLSMPKSIGEIFGLLYASEAPVSFDDVVTRLGVSKGSASQGLRFLQRIRAIRPVYVLRDRRTFYEPEMSLRKILNGILSENVVPHLREGEEQLESLQALTRENENLSPVVRERIDRLKTWNKRARRTLPMISRLVAGAEKAE